MKSVADRPAASTAPALESWRTHLDAHSRYCDAHGAASRNGTLCKLAGWLWRRGLAADDVEALLLAVNDRLFRTPRAKVLTIAPSAWRAAPLMTFGVQA